MQNCSPYVAANSLCVRREDRQISDRDEHEANLTLHVRRDAFTGPDKRVLLHYSLHYMFAYGHVDPA